MLVEDVKSQVEIRQESGGNGLEKEEVRDEEQSIKGRNDSVGSNHQVSPEEIINYQIRQPIRRINPNNLDSLLLYGIGDYIYQLTNDSTDSTDSERIQLGNGRFSTVYSVSKGKGVETLNYAMKVTPLYNHHPLISARLLREATLLSQLPPHPSLVKVYEEIRTPSTHYLIVESLANSITLEEYSQRGSISVDDSWIILNQLCSVLELLKNNSVCHRDIKPENVLITEGGVTLITLIDFGLATRYSKSKPKLSTVAGSPAYHSPEILQCLRAKKRGVNPIPYWGPEVDIWTLGLTLLSVVIRRRYPIGANHLNSSLTAIQYKVGDALIDVKDITLRKVLKSFLVIDGDERIENFNEYCAGMKIDARSNDEVSGPSIKFKSISFIKTKVEYSINLPIISRESFSRSSSIAPSTRDRTDSLLYSNHYFQSSAASSPQLSDLSLWSPPLYIDSPISSYTSSLPPPDPIEIVLLNVDRIEFSRCVSFIRYCLRCAGILYHHTNEQSDNLIILQVVVQLPPLETSTSTAEALLRNLRPTRSQSMNPSKAKKEKPIATLVEALVFYVSIREDILLSRRDRKSEKRIIIQLSDDRGLAIIRDAVTLDDSTITPERGRRRSTNGTNGGLKRDSVGKSLNCSPVHSRAGSRAASESRFAVFGHAFGLLGL